MPGDMATYGKQPSTFWGRGRGPGRVEALRRWSGAAQGTQAGFKNELLFREYGINYNNLPARFRKVPSSHPAPVAL